MKIFGFIPEFIGRLENISDKIMKGRLLIYVGEGREPTFAENYFMSAMNYSSENLDIDITDDDYGAIYFSSGTTGFPKAILHKHRALMHAALCEQNHHGQTKDDVFLCIPPLYHTGAKMHWFGSFLVGAKSVLLYIAGGYDLGMREVEKIASSIQSQVDEDCVFKFGACITEDMANEVRVTVVATGFDEGLGNGEGYGLSNEKKEQQKLHE